MRVDKTNSNKDDDDDNVCCSMVYKLLTHCYTYQKTKPGYSMAVSFHSVLPPFAAIFAAASNRGLVSTKPKINTEGDDTNVNLYLYLCICAHIHVCVYLYVLYMLNDSISFVCLFTCCANIVVIFLSNHKRQKSRTLTLIV